MAFRFRCSGCGYTATVSGGPDAGLGVRTRTMACETCDELVDVVVEVDARDEEWDESQREEVGRCSSCGGIRLTDWGREKDPLDDFTPVRGEDWGPCPRCGEAIRPTGASLIWD